MSLSARRAWIEIWRMYTCKHVFSVALRKESVDRNPENLTMKQAYSLSLSARRAWIEMPLPSALLVWPTSLSARRAWIEIHRKKVLGCRCGVALRKESVDRNIMRHLLSENMNWSLSARRAWIEIGISSSVYTSFFGRSPQGERG